MLEEPELAVNALVELVTSGNALGTVARLRRTSVLSMHPETVSYLLGPPLHEKKSADGLPLRLFCVHTADTPRAYEAGLP